MRNDISSILATFKELLYVVYIEGSFPRWSKSYTFCQYIFYSVCRFSCWLCVPFQCVIIVWPMHKQANTTSSFQGFCILASICQVQAWLVVIYLEHHHSNIVAILFNKSVYFDLQVCVRDLKVQINFHIFNMLTTESALLLPVISLLHGMQYITTSIHTDIKWNLFSDLTINVLSNIFYFLVLLELIVNQKRL